MMYKDDYFQEWIDGDEYTKGVAQHENDAAEECTRRMETFAEWKQEMKIDTFGEQL